MPSPNPTASTTSPAPPAPPTLPSPLPFDILTTLNTLLHRLLTDSPSADDPSSPSDHHLQHAPNARHPPLAIKDFSSEALKVKNTLTEARRALQSMPDLDKSLLEQEVQIKKLERAIERKREMVRRVGAESKGGGMGEVGRMEE